MKSKIQKITVASLKIFIYLTLFLLLYSIVKYFIPESFIGFEDGINGIVNVIIDTGKWIYEHSLEIFLLWLGRFTKNFKDNVKAYFSAIVLFSTFRLNIARYRALKGNEKNGIPTVDM